MRRWAILFVLVIVVAMHCSREVPSVFLPRDAKKVGANVYTRLVLHGQGPLATCGELYGYNASVVGIFGVSDKDEDHVMLRRDQLDPDWRALILSMREGDRARAWIKVRPGNGFREYDVFLARVDRLDQQGRAQPQEHEHLCR
jgi:hypothetical protein